MEDIGIVVGIQDLNRFMIYSFQNWTLTSELMRVSHVALGSWVQKQQPNSLYESMEPLYPVEVTEDMIMVEVHICKPPKSFIELPRFRYLTAQYENLAVAPNFGTIFSQFALEDRKLYKAVIVCRQIKNEEIVSIPALEKMKTCWNIASILGTEENSSIIELHAKKLEEMYNLPFPFQDGKSVQRRVPISNLEDVPKFPQDELIQHSLNALKCSQKIMAVINEIDPEAYSYINQQEKFFD